MPTEIQTLRAELERKRALLAMRLSEIEQPTPDIGLQPPSIPAATTGVAPPEIPGQFGAPDIGLSAGVTPPDIRAGEITEQAPPTTEVLGRGLAEALEAFSAAPIKSPIAEINQALREQQTTGQNILAGGLALSPFLVPGAGQGLFALEAAKAGLDPKTKLPQLLVDLIEASGEGIKATLGVSPTVLKTILATGRGLGKLKGLPTAPTPPEPILKEIEAESEKAFREKPVETVLGAVTPPLIAAGVGLVGAKAVSKVKAVKKIGEKPTLKPTEPIFPKPTPKIEVKVPEVTKPVKITKEPTPIVPKPKKVPPVTPIKAPEVVKPKVVEPLEAVALKKETITQIRKDYELEKLPKPERKGFEQSAKEAIETGAKDNALLTAEEVIKSKRAVTDVEHAGMAIKATELMNEYEAVLSNIGKQGELGNIQGVKLGQKRADVILNQLETITKGSDFAGTELGRGLSIRRMLVNRNDFSVARLKLEAKATKGNKLSEQQNKLIESQAVKIKTSEKRVADLQKKYADILENQEKVIAERIHQRELQKTGIKAKSKAVKKKIQSDRDKIKSEIRKLGIRVNEATGVSAEGSFLIGKLAVNYIKEGVTTLKEVTQKVLNDIPSIKERDIHRALNAKDPARQRKARTQAQKNTQLLKREARLIIDLEKAEKGIFKEPPKKGEIALGVQATTLRNIKDMQGKLRALKANFNRTISDGKRLERAFNTVHELQDMLDGQFRAIKARKAPDPIHIKALKEKSQELRKLMRTQDEIANLSEQMRTGDFIIREKQTLKRQPQDLERAQVELNQLRKKVRRSIENMAPLTPGRVTREVINTLRVFKATADMSYVLRQGLVLSARRPGLAAKSFGKAFQATFSEMKAAQIDNALRRAPHHYIRELAGLDLPEIGGKITAREEMFMSNFAERIPGYNKIVQASERNMTTGLNMLRAGAFDEFLNKFPNATLPEMKAYADYINVASGRGNLGRFASAGNLLGSIFFAPRFAASRFQTPYSVFKNWKNPRIRNEIAKDMAAVGGMGLTILTLADLAGADVNFDFDSADFAKIKVGNTRIDMWAGIQQPMRLLMQIGAVPTKAKIAWGQAPLELISRFTQYKASPGITLPIELAIGRTIIGQPTTIPESLARTVVPLAFQDILDAYKEGGLDRAALSTGLEFFGVGVNTYNKATKRKK